MESIEHIVVPVKRCSESISYRTSSLMCRFRFGSSFSVQISWNPIHNWPSDPVNTCITNQRSKDYPLCLLELAWPRRNYGVLLTQNICMRKEFFRVRLPPMAIDLPTHLSYSRFHLEGSDKIRFRLVASIQTHNEYQAKVHVRTFLGERQKLQLIHNRYV